MSAPGPWIIPDVTLHGASVSHRQREGVGVPLLFVHGIGPGTTAEVNFGALVDHLPTDAPVHLIDLAGFGRSRPRPEGPGFDVAMWLDQIAQALDWIGRPTLVIGNSVGAALALKIAARRRDLHGVLAIAAPVAPMAATAELAAFWRTPRDPEALAAAMRPMTAAQLAPDPAALAARWRAFADPAHGVWFGGALAQPDACLAQVALAPDEAARIQAPVQLLHGRQDRACPVGPLVSFVLEHLPGADLTLLSACGHNVVAERTADVLAAINRAILKGPTP